MVTLDCGCKTDGKILFWACQRHYAERVEALGHKFNKEADDRFLKEIGRKA
jgi:hypothetical protein